MAGIISGYDYIEFKRREVIIRIDEYTKAYKSRTGTRYSEPREKVYMIHQDMPDGKCPVNVYIGKTKQVLIKRLSQHTNEVIKARKKQYWTMKIAWMDRILRNGFSLKIELLNNVPKPLIYQIESEWITYLSLRGFNVMNMDNKKYWNARKS